MIGVQFPNLVIRLCEAADISTVHKLQDEWSKEEVTYGFIPDDQQTLHDHLGPYFVVAEVENSIIGYCFAKQTIANNICVLPEGSHVIEIVDLYVRNQFRRRGIGHALVDWIFNCARENGIMGAFLYSSTKDSRNITHFYEQHGFRTWFVEMYTIFE